MVFTEIAWAFWTCLGRTDIFTKLNLQNHEHGMSFHFLWTWKFSPNNRLEFSAFKCCISFYLFPDNSHLDISVNRNNFFFPFRSVYSQCLEIQEVFPDSPCISQLIIYSRNLYKDSFGFSVHKIEISVSEFPPGPCLFFPLRCLTEVVIQASVFCP